MTINEPVHNLEIEQQVIGLLIKDPTHSNSRETLDSLSVEDFYSTAHRYIFDAIKVMTENKKDITLDLINEELKFLDFNCGGIVYLAEMMRHAFGISNMASYVAVVKKCASLRNLALVISNTNDQIRQELETTDIIEQLDNEIKSISINSSGKDLRHIKDVEGDFLDTLEERAKKGGAIAGLSTGFDQLDERINGIGDECLVVVAGSPSMGKTLFCQSIASNVGVDQGKNVMFFSMEMSEQSLFERFVSGLGNINPASLKSARISPEENGRIDMAVRALRTSGLYLTDEPKQSVGQIRAKVRRHKIKHPELSAVFIDYLGLMKLGKADRHDIAIGNITRDLKELAKEMRVPIILCVQSKRPQNIRDRPNMASLKDSSCIEADADLIMFVHRQEILEPETELKGVTELIIAKDRHNDGNGTVYLEKCNGTFRGLSIEAVAKMQHDEELRIKPQTKKAKGFASI